MKWGSHQALSLGLVSACVLWLWWGMGLCVSVLDQVLFVLFPASWVAVVWIAEKKGLV